MWGSVPLYPKSVPTPSQDGVPAVGQGPFLGYPLIPGAAVRASKRAPGHRKKARLLSTRPRDNKNVWEGL